MAVRMEVDLAAELLELRVQRLDGRGPRIEDRVAIAAEPLHLAREVRTALRVHHQVRAGMGRFERGHVAPRGRAREAPSLEVAQHEARGHAVAPFATAQPGRLAAFELEQRLEEAVAVHAL